MSQTKRERQRLHRYPYLLGLLTVAAISVMAQILVILDCVFPVLVHDTDAVSSVMSTCSEVIAGLYGITLTGYIFFADRFQNTSRDDESLYDAVQALLLRQYHNLALHDLSMTVSQEMCDLAKETLAELKNKK